MNARRAKKHAQKGAVTKNKLRKQLLLVENAHAVIARRVQRIQQEHERVCLDATVWRDRALAAEKLLNQEADEVMSNASHPFMWYPSIENMEMTARTLQIQGKLHVGESIDLGRVFMHDRGQNTEAIKANLVRRFTQMAQDHAVRAFRVIRG